LAFGAAGGDGAHECVPTFVAARQSRRARVKLWQWFRFKLDDGRVVQVSIRMCAVRRWKRWLGGSTNTLGYRVFPAGPLVLAVAVRDFDPGFDMP
jgi:hypothetical protein